MLFSHNPTEIARCIKQGGVIAYPSESVYALGCDPLNEEAVKRLLTLKNRSIDKGLIIAIHHFSQVADWLHPVAPLLMEKINQSWPGPVTWVFSCRNTVPTFLRGTHKSLAIRLSAHPVMQALCQACGPIISTSANVAGQEALKDWRKLEKTFPAIDALWTGDLGGLDQPSTIIDAQTGKILRQGPFTL